jgi:hypothetical protein
MSIVGIVGNALRFIIAALLVWVLISGVLIVTSLGLMKALGVL